MGLSSEQRAQLEQLKTLRERILQDNPLEGLHTCPEPCGDPQCRPHPKQHEFLSSHDPVKAFFGGNQSGKTTAGIIDDIIQAVDREALPERLGRYKKFEPPFYCRIVAPDLQTTVEKVIFEKLREWLPRSQLKGDSFDTAYRKQTRKLEFKNGSWFDFMSFEMDLDKFGGVTLHRLHYDEEPPEEIRKEGGPRLMKYGGDEIFTMTPLQGMTWMFDGIYERRFEDGFKVVVVDMDDNPHLDEEAKQRALDGLTHEERQARKEGRFVHFAGLVFPEFKEEHVVEPVSREHLKGQDIVVGIDPGLNYAGAVWLAFDDENHAVAFDELFLTNIDIERMSEAIHEKNRHWGFAANEVLFVIDPSARNRTLVNSEMPQAEFQRFGIFAINGKSDQETGAFQIKRRLQNQPPALLLTRNCQEFIKEMRQARKADTPDGKFKLLKESSPNRRNEVLDAGRYGLMSRPWMYVPERDERHKPWTPGVAPSAAWFDREPDDVLI